MHHYKFFSCTCIYKGDNDHMYKRKESTSDIHQFLQYVEKKFSDVLIPASQLETQEYLGKGTYAYMFACALNYEHIIHLLYL